MSSIAFDRGKLPIWGAFEIQTFELPSEPESAFIGSIGLLTMFINNCLLNINSY